MNAPTKNKTNCEDNRNCNNRSNSSNSNSSNTADGNVAGGGGDEWVVKKSSKMRCRPLRRSDCAVLVPRSITTTSSAAGGGGRKTGKNCAAAHDGVGSHPKGSGVDSASEDSFRSSSSEKQNILPQSNKREKNDAQDDGSSSCLDFPEEESTVVMDIENDRYSADLESEPSDDDEDNDSFCNTNHHSAVTIRIENIKQCNNESSIDTGGNTTTAKDEQDESTASLNIDNDEHSVGLNESCRSLLEL